MEVFVTPRAERNFDAIIDYLKQKWGEKTDAQFVQGAFVGGLVFRLPEFIF